MACPIIFTGSRLGIFQKLQMSRHVWPPRELSVELTRIPTSLAQGPRELSASTRLQAVGLTPGTPVASSLLHTALSPLLAFPGGNVTPWLVQAEV